MTKYLFLLGTVAALGTANAHVTEGYRVMHDGSFVHSSMVVDGDSPVMFDKDKADYINYGHMDRIGNGGVVDGDPYDEVGGVGNRSVDPHNASVDRLLETARSYKGDSPKLEAIYHQVIGHNEAIRRAGGTPKVSDDEITTKLRAYGCDPEMCYK